MYRSCFLIGNCGCSVIFQRYLDGKLSCSFRCFIIGLVRGVNIPICRTSNLVEQRYGQGHGEGTMVRGVNRLAGTVVGEGYGRSEDGYGSQEEEEVREFARSECYCKWFFCYLVVLQKIRSVYQNFTI